MLELLNVTMKLAYLRYGFQTHASRVHSCRAGIAAKEVPAIAAHCAGGRVAVLAPLLSVHQVAELLLGKCSTQCRTAACG